MRKKITNKVLQSMMVVLLSLTATNLFSQVPNPGIFFQAVARDNFANPAKDRKIYVQSSIVQTTATGTKVLTEEFQTTTDATGVFSISIGQGTRVGGTIANLANIDWASGPYFLNLKVAITPVAPNNNWDYTKEWVDLGTTSFGAVPYALYAGTATGLDGKLNSKDTAGMLSVYAKVQAVKTLETTVGTKVASSDTAAMLAPYKKMVNEIIASNITSLTADAINNALDSKVNLVDSNVVYVTPTQLNTNSDNLTSAINLKLDKNDTASLSNRINTKANTIDVNAALDLKAPLNSPNLITPSLGDARSSSIYIGTNTINTAAVLDVESTTKGVLLPRMTLSQRNAIDALVQGLIIYCTDCNGGVGELQIFNGKSWDKMDASNKMYATGLEIDQLFSTTNGTRANSVGQSFLTGSLGGYVSKIITNGIGGITGTQLTNGIANSTLKIRKYVNDVEIGTGNALTGQVLATSIGTPTILDYNYGQSNPTTEFTFPSGVYLDANTRYVIEFVNGSGVGVYVKIPGQYADGKAYDIDGANLSFDRDVPFQLYLAKDTVNYYAKLNSKAPINNPTFTGTVSGITKGMVGLGNIDNTTDLGKPISTATQTALDLKEPAANKSTNIITDAASDIKFPSVKSVKTYVDDAIAVATIPDATLIAKGKLALAGDLTGTAAEPRIAVDAVTTAKIKDANITTAKIDDAAVITSKIADANITTAKIDDAAIITSKIADANITEVKIKDDAVTTNKIKDANITDAKIATVSGSKVIGNISGNASTATALASGRTISTTGDITYTSESFDGSANVTGVATLANSGVISGTYGSPTEMPSITIDSKGRITSATTTSIIAGVNTVNAIAATSNSNGATVSGTTITLTPADASNGGVVTTGTQTFAGDKTFSNSITAPSFIGDLTGNATTATTAGNITATSNNTLTSLTNLAEVGTITTGTWSGTTIAIANGGTGATSAVSALSNLGAEPTANKSAATDLGGVSASDNFFPTQGAVKRYVDSSVNVATTSGVPDATTSLKGILILTNDLGGTASSPSVVSVGGSTASNIHTAELLANAATDVNTNSTIVKRDGSGNFSAGTITASLTGNASTATKLAASKNINGVAFDGSGDITVTANAGTLTGNTLNSTVTGSSLTSVGTITSGTWNGNTIAVGYGGTGATSLTGLIKGNGTSAFTEAIAGSDYQAPITLTTSNNVGAATFSGTTLNIPNYTLAGLGGIGLTGLSATAPLTYSSSTGTFSITQANTNTDGYLSYADWNTFNGKQNALTNPITGTGMQDYLSKFSSTSAMTSSQIYDNGTTVSIGTASPNSSAAFEINSTKAFLLPRLTTTEQNALSSKTAGMFIYNTTDNKFQGYGSSAWNNLAYTSDLDNYAPLAGSSSITTLGTISSGTWSSTVIGKNYGGAGDNNGMLKANGSGVVSTAVAGTDYQVPLSAGTGITLSSNTLSIGQDIATSAIPTFVGATLTGLNTAGIVTNTAAGVLGTLATSGSGNVALTTGANFSTPTITNATMNGTFSGTTIIPVANGGLGTGSLTSGYVKAGATNFSTVSSIPVTDITGAVVNVNGQTPDQNGRVNLTFGSVKTGTLSGISTPTANGDIYVVSNDDQNSAYNGRTFITTGASAGTYTWTEVVSNQATLDSRYVRNSGGTMAASSTLDFPSSSILSLNFSPTSSNHAVNMGYVDNAITTKTPSATVSARGLIQLAGDLTGTADAPLIKDNVVGFTKMQTISSNTILGRSAASSGNIETLTTIPTAVMPALTGDITTSAGTISTTIATGAVTLAKLANLTATSKLIGSNSSTNAPAEITLGTGLTISGNTLNATGGTVTSLSGTASRTTVTNGTTTPVVDISSIYAGQNSINTLGTITTGAWNGSTIAVAYGGTGANTLTGYVKGNGTSNMTASSTIPVADVTGAELIANKSTDISTDAASTDKYPSVKLVKDYIDTKVAGATIADATSSSKGKLKLAGDLGGTADLPTVAKINGVSLGTTTATNKNILIADGSAWQSVAMSGDVTIANTGATTIGASKVTNAMLAGSIDLTTKVTGALPVANGGTGLSTTSQNYIFAGPTSGSGAPSFRAMVSGDLPAGSSNYVANNATATAQSSTSFNVDGAGKIGTTLTVGGAGTFSSTLSVAGALTSSTSSTSPILIGGTGTTSSLTYKTTSGVGTATADHIFQVGNNGATEAMRILNNGNIGIGTAAAKAKLEVYGGDLLVGGTSSAYDNTNYADKNGFVIHQYNGATSLVSTGASTGNWTSNIAFLTRTTGATVPTEKMIITSDGKVGIGVSPTSLLHVNGTANITGILTAGGITYPNTNGTSGQYLTTNGSGTASWASIPSNNLSTSAVGVLPVLNGGTGVTTSTGSGSVVLSTSPTLVTPVLGAATGTSLSLSSTSSHGGAATFSSTVNVSGATTLASTLAVTGATTLNGNTSVTGSNTLTVGSGATSLGGTLLVTGAGTFSSTLSAGATTLTSANVTGNETVGGTLGVTGATTLTSVTATGAATFSSTVKIPTSAGLNKVLTSDASGNATWTYGSSAVSKPTATATILISDKYVFYDGAANGTLTLPAATGNAGKEIIIKNRTTKVVTVSRSASETIFIDSANTAATTFTIGSEASNNWVKLVSDGANWVVFRALF